MGTRAADLNVRLSKFSLRGSMDREGLNLDESAISNGCKTAVVNIFVNNVMHAIALGKSTSWDGNRIHR